MDEQDTLVLPHLSLEFYVWLWYASERDGGTMDLGEEVSVWVDERLAFQLPGETKARAVVTGDNTSTSLEAKAALASGKVVRDLQLHLQREEREYDLTLRGPNLDIVGLKLPPHSADGEDGLLYERMFLVEDVWSLLGKLYRRFAEERVGESWSTTILPAIREWAGGEPERELD